MSTALQQNCAAAALTARDMLHANAAEPAKVQNCPDHANSAPGVRCVLQALRRRPTKMLRNKKCPKLTVLHKTVAEPL